MAAVAPKPPSNDTCVTKPRLCLDRTRDTWACGGPERQKRHSREGESSDASSLEALVGLQWVLAERSEQQKRHMLDDLISTFPVCRGFQAIRTESYMTYLVTHCRWRSPHELGGYGRRCRRLSCPRPCVARTRWPFLSAPTTPGGMPCTRMWHPTVQSPRGCVGEGPWESMWRGCALVPRSGCWCCRRILP